MKKTIVLAFIAAILSLMPSCVTIKPHWGTVGTYLDYTPYTNEGFFITESNSVSFPYTSKGSVVAYVYSGYFKRSKHWVNATPETALKVLVDKARDAGADGLINMEFSTFNTEKDGVPLSGVVVTAMAIKRDTTAE